MNETPKYPEIKVDLTDCNGNALAIVARVGRIMKRLGVPRHAIKRYRDESFSGHDEFVATASRWVAVT